MGIGGTELGSTFLLEVKDQLLEVSRYCPHRSGRLDHGKVNSKAGTITCPLHSSAFCLRTGAQISGPACGPIKVRILSAANGGD